MKLLETALKVTTTGLKTLGFGLVYNGVQDTLLGDDAKIYDYVAMTVGGFSWLLGLYLEKRAQAAANTHPKQSTAIITQCLGHLGGAGLVCSISHLIKHNGTTFSSTNLMAEALTAPAAVEEFYSSESRKPKLKWEKSRFLITLLGDYLLAANSMKFMNGESLDTFSFAALALGTAIDLAELIYSLKYDWTQLSLAHVLNRRGIKVCVGLGTIFTVLDIVNDLQERYLIADDALTLAINLFLFASLVEMQRIANAPTELEIDLLQREDEEDEAYVVSIITDANVIEENLAPPRALTR